MIDDGLFTDTSQVQTITPYRKLRNLRGWSLEEAAEQFAASRHLLIAIELGRRDCPKWLVRKMDKEYGCGGKLIEYWLPRFSLAPVKKYGVLERIWLWIKQWMTL
jgi:DNA-binding XRE family transcriptional regulator